MTDYQGDSFYDCQSVSESDDENSEKIIPIVGDDQLKIRQTLERAVNYSRLLLRSVGGTCDNFEHLDQHSSATFFYPATLEICARLLTDKSCASSPSCRCRLRGEPVTMQLPMELNPHSGQVNVHMFQHGPKALTGFGSCHCAGAGDRQQSNAGAATQPKKEAGADANISEVSVVNNGLVQVLTPRSGVGPGTGFSPSGMRRLTQRHDCVHKGGRKVRWPDIL